VYRVNRTPTTLPTSMKSKRVINETTIIISGATSGIGYEILKLLLPLNLKIILIGRNLFRLDDILNDIQSSTTKLECDLSSTCDENVFEYLKKQISSLVGGDKIILISNAGDITLIKKITNISQKNIINNFSVNLFSPIAILLGIKENKAWRNLKLQCINISSGAADTPIPGWSLYCSAKASVKMFLDVLQVEEPLKVKVIHFDPGVVDTKMQSLIRASNENDFPLVNNFINFKKFDNLARPNHVAKEILKLIEL